MNLPQLSLGGVARRFRGKYTTSVTAFMTQLQDPSLAMLNIGF